MSPRAVVGGATVFAALGCGTPDFVIEEPFYRATLTAQGDDACDAVASFGAPVARMLPSASARGGFVLELGHASSYCEDDGDDVACRPFYQAVDSEKVLLHGFMDGVWDDEALALDLEVYGVCAYDDPVCEPPEIDVRPVPCHSVLSLGLARVDPQPEGDAAAPDGGCEALADAVGAPIVGGGALDLFNYSGVPIEVAAIGAGGAAVTVAGSDELGEPGHAYLEVSNDGVLYEVTAGGACVTRFVQLGPWQVIGGVTP